MNELPRISVIVPSRNGGRTIGACLESIAALDYPDFEVIVIDDGSTDDTGHIAAAFAARLPSVKLLRGAGTGPSAARNRAVEASAGTYVAFTDDDCIVDRQWLREMLRGFTAPASGGRPVAGVGGNQLSPDDESEFGRTVNGFMKTVGFVADYVKSDGAAAVRETDHNPSCNVMYPRELCARYRFPEGLWPGEDVELDHRLTKAGFIHRYNPGAVVRHYRTSTASGFLRMMFNYGKAQGYLVRRYGPFRRIHFVPVAVAGYLALLAVAARTGISVWVIDVPLAAALIYFLFRDAPRAVRYLLLTVITLVGWNAGFFRGLCAVLNPLRKDVEHS
jgi:glycosyltransferase involved in cell wall biosynthesis